MNRFMMILILSLSSLPSWAVSLNETEALSLLLKNNLEVMASKYNIEFSKAQELTAGLWANPTVLLDSQLNPFGGNWNQKNAGGPTQRDLVLNIPVDLNGKRSQAVQVQKLATQVEEVQFQAEVRGKMVELLTDAFDLLRIHKEVELLIEKKELLEKSVLALEKRIGGGSNQPLVQNRAKLAMESAKIELENKKTEQQVLENDIRTVLALSPTEEIKLDLNFAQVSESSLSEEALMKNSLEYRPESIAFKLLKKQSEEDIRLQHKLVFDDVTFQAGLSRQEMVNSRPNTPGSNSLGSAWSWLVGVNIPLPIFDRNQGNVMKASLLKNQIELRERFYLVKLKQDINSSIKKIVRLSSNIKLFRSNQLTNARIVRDSAFRQFGTGGTTLIEYLDAVEAYHSTISQYVSAQYELTAEGLNLRNISGEKL
jgi:cobalt-zinc-cadmium efflux system outer membrane protein